MAHDANGSVYELKFLLPGDCAEAVTAWMRASLRADPHGTGEHGDRYLVQSIYLDTEGLDVYHRRGSFARAKFRVRRYGEDPLVFLERKMKREGIVRKRRIGVPFAELENLNAEANGSGWPGSWFHHRVELRRLRPVVRMSYLRLARLGVGEHGVFRVTLDRDLRAALPLGFLPPEPLIGPDLFRGNAIMEVKFRNTLPQPMKGLVESLALTVGPFSKYRTGVRACGLAPENDVQEKPDASPAPPHA